MPNLENHAAFVLRKGRGNRLNFEAAVSTACARRAHAWVQLHFII
jgi:hypothetical protein